MKNLILAVLVCGCGSAFGQSSTRFNITRGVVGGGGSTTSGSSRFQMSGTVGQPVDTTPGANRFSVLGGFWITPSPVLFGANVVGTNFLVSIQSEPGMTYSLQYAGALGVPWVSFSPIAGTGGIITVTNSVAGSVGRFYRLVEQ